MDNLRISISNYRAIEKAEISMNGITVLSGTNGTGKSTISRLVYEIVECANNFERLIVKEINHHLGKYFNVLKNLVYLIESSSSSHNIFYDMMNSLTIDSIDDIPIFERTVSTLCDEVLRLYDEDHQVARLNSRRIQSLLSFTLDERKDIPIADALEIMKNSIHQRVESGQRMIRTRPSSLFIENIKDILGDNVANCVSVSEYGEFLFGGKNSHVPLPHFIQDAFYINTPFILGAASDSDHVIKLNDALMNPRIDYVRSMIADDISNSIIHGRARFEGKNGLIPGFRFFSNLNEEFNLQDCATGVKAFSIIQMLINNGYIKNNTLLILDEPEAHLHPQWIVEYARLIVLMYKELGVNFLISTHSTDMVIALKYIAEAQQCMKVLEFFHAKKGHSEGKYIYESLGLNIDPIFQSFNNSFDKLESYAILKSSSM